MDIGQLRVGKGYVMVTVGQQGKPQASLKRSSRYHFKIQDLRIVADYTYITKASI